MYNLIINGTTMPEPALEGIQIEKNKVWSSDTGRVSNGEMVGTLVAIKAKVSIKWPAISESDAAIIQNATSDASTPWSTMVYTDMDGKEKTITVYFGDLTGTRYSDVDGMRWIENASVNGVEK